MFLHHFSVMVDCFGKEEDICFALGTCIVTSFLLLPLSRLNWFWDEIVCVICERLLGVLITMHVSFM